MSNPSIRKVHNQVPAQLFQDISKYYDSKVDVQYWYEHMPDRVVENGKVTALWDSKIIIDRHLWNQTDKVVKEVSGSIDGNTQWLQHPEEGHREGQQVCGSPD